MAAITEELSKSAPADAAVATTNVEGGAVDNKVIPPTTKEADKPLDFGAKDDDGDNSDDGFIDFTPVDDSDDSDNQVESASAAAAVDTNQINNSAAAAADL